MLLLKLSFIFPFLAMQRVHETIYTLVIKPNLFLVLSQIQLSTCKSDYRLSLPMCFFFSETTFQSFIPTTFLYFLWLHIAHFAFHFLSLCISSMQCMISKEFMRPNNFPYPQQLSSKEFIRLNNLPYP